MAAAVAPALVGAGSLEQAFHPRQVRAGYEKGKPEERGGEQERPDGQRKRPAPENRLQDSEGQGDGAQPQRPHGTPSHGCGPEDARMNPPVGAA